MIRSLRRALAHGLRVGFLTAWAVVLSISAARAQSAPAKGSELTLGELLRFAENNAPAARLAERRRGYGAAAREEAAALRHNPTLELGLGPRFDGAGGRDFDFFAALAQPLELAGERGLRRNAAERTAERVDAERGAVRWELRREVTLAYYAAVVARARIASSERLLRFADELRRVAAKRLAAGDASAIDVQLAQADYAEAQLAQVLAEEALQRRRLHLAEVTGWSLLAPPNVPAELEAPRPAPPLAALLRAAARRHPELAARRAATLEARAKTALAEREVWPVPALGVQVAREGSAVGRPSYTLLGTVALPLPLWQRNQGERSRTRVDAEVLLLEQSTAEQALFGRVARAHVELESAARRLAIFGTSVTASLESSLALLERGFVAGELPLASVSVARERFLKSEQAALDAYRDYYAALAELEFALGAQLGVAAQPAPGGAP